MHHHRYALIVVSLFFVSCAGLWRAGKAGDPRTRGYDRPRTEVWQAVRAALAESYEVVEEYEQRGVMHTDWKFETKGDRAYRSRVNAWMSGTGPYRVEFEVEMYVRGITAPSDVRTEKGERKRANELYRALDRRLNG